MCRLWGVSYGPDGPEAEMWTPEEMAAIMFPSLVAQGPDAYGWMTWSGEEHVDVHKYEGRCDTPEALASFEKVDPAAKWIVAHTRWATHGSPAKMLNNHPIHHGNVVGVHNGKIRNYRQILDETGRQNAATEVDSEAIFAAVNKWGNRAGLLRINGDMVTVFTHLDKPGTLHIAKSNGRPLVMAKTKAGSLIWASEEQALDALGVELTGHTELGVNRLLTIVQGTIKSRVQYRTESWKDMAPRRNVVREMQNGSSERLPATKPKTQRTRKAKSDSTPVVLELPPPRTAGREAWLEEAREIAAKRGITDGTCIDGLYYYDGVLLTEREYIEAIARAEGYQ